MPVNFLGNFNFSKAIKLIAPNNNPCPDQVVGSVDYPNTTFPPLTTRVDINYANKNLPNKLTATITYKPTSKGIYKLKPTKTYKLINNPTIKNKLTEPIVIILESPHKDEFDPITLMALGPAMGNTGRNLVKHFDSLIQNSSIYNYLTGAPHDIVLVNAIQYQCSLGNNLSGKGSYQNKKQRDKNWLACFNAVNSNDLLNRIDAIKPFAIINLCTFGLFNLQLHLDRTVRQYIQTTQPQTLYTIGKHPSSWHISYNRIIQ